MKHWPEDQVFPDKEFYLSRGIHLPTAKYPLGFLLDSSIGPAKIVGFKEFPLCQYDCELLEGEHAGKHVSISYTWEIPWRPEKIVK